MLLQATPYVPGCVRGVLSRDPRQVTPRTILVLTQRTLQLLGTHPAGLVVIGGAPLSHSMIRVLGVGLPTVIVTTRQGRGLNAGDEVIVDGARGLIVSPDQAPGTPPVAPVPPRAGNPILTADNVAVHLRASVADAVGATHALTNGATGLGLVRSEFIASKSVRQPDADFLEHGFAAVCAAAHPLAVTLRLPDIAADKRPAWLGPPHPMHGTLGLQGCRLYATEPVRSVFQAAVAAIARLALKFELSLLIPYVTRPEEFLHWRREVEARLPTPMAVGCMAETPAAVLEMRTLLDVADFVSIGCNDLMQCLFGADRDIAEVSGLLDPYAPVMYRLLRHVAELAGDRVAEIQLCGLLPQVPGVLPVLLGLGYRKFSVEPVLIPYLAATVRHTDMHQAEILAAGVCAEPDAARVRALLGLAHTSTWAFGTHAGSAVSVG